MPTASSLAASASSHRSSSDLEFDRLFIDPASFGIGPIAAGAKSVRSLGRAVSSLPRMDQGVDPVERAAQFLRAAVAGMHRDSAREPIRWPDASGAFPADFLLRPPPVVVDANILRNDVLRSCRTGQRTVLVTAANAGLLRMFCAEHVYQEVIEHSGDWTASGPITRDCFLGNWLSEYLPLLRIVKINEGQLGWLDPVELTRAPELAAKDPDDAPSAVLALLLRAFFLSHDGPALRAVYGPTDPSEHQR